MNLNTLQLHGQILRERYELIFASSGAATIEAATEDRPDLILLNIMMPEMNGYEVCAKLKADPTMREIPVIFVTAMGDVEDEAHGFVRGGRGLYSKTGFRADSAAPCANASLAGPAAGTGGKPP